MRILFTKCAGKQDWMECLRDDGTSTRCPMPKQGILPHDFVHYVVEDTLDLRQGFWGILAIGVGFPTSTPPWDAADFDIPDLTQALQAESLVECFQAEMWNGFQPSEDFIALFQVACQSRYIPILEISLPKLQQVRSRLQIYSQQWEKLAIGESSEVDFMTFNLLN